MPTVITLKILTVFISASRDPSSRFGGIRDDTDMVMVLGRSGDSQTAFCQCRASRCESPLLPPTPPGRLSSRLSLRVGLCEGKLLFQGLLIPLTHLFPVHNIPESIYIFGPSVLVFQIIGVFPDIESQ